MIRFFRRLSGDQRGAAAIELGIMTSGFFLLAMGAFDFGGAYMQRGQINEAVSAAAVKSFESRDNVGFSDLQSYVRNLSDNQSLNVSLSCNGVANSCTNFNRTCSCLKTDGSFVSAACDNTCSGADLTPGSTAGYYLTIKGEQPYQTVLLPKAVLSSSMVSQSVTIRLQ